MRETADVVVIGAGTTGCAIAWHLARSGAAVRLVERSDIGAGASGASPGIVRQYYADSTLAILARAGLDTYRHWGDVVGGECGYRRTGFATAVSIAQEQTARAHIAALQAKGIELEWWPREILGRRFPDLQGDDLAGAVFEADAGYCDARATALTYAHRAHAYGTIIDIRCAALRIVVQGDGVAAVETERGRIDCGIVVNAAGPWAATLAARCGAPVPISASRQGVAIFSIGDEKSAILPGFSDRDAGFYLRPDSPGRYFIGSLRADDSGATDPDNVGRAMDDAEAIRYRDRAARRFARLAEAIPIGRRVSFFDDTPDGNPLFGPDPRISGLFIAAGLSGHGFKFAPVFGQAADDWVSGRRMRPEIYAFAVERALE